MLKRQLYLASASERRRQILTQYRIPFSVIENKLSSEDLDLSLGFKKAIRTVAWQKADASKGSLKGLILGVDTVVSIDDLILGKPQHIEQAKQFLRILSDHTHQVTTGIALIDTISQTSICRTQTSFVTFKRLSEDEILYYCTHYDVLDKAGAYGIQDYASRFVDQIKGSYETIVGLPIQLLLRLLKPYKIF